jgi:hypothetical protein
MLAFRLHRHAMNLHPGAIAMNLTEETEKKEN